MRSCIYGSINAGIVAISAGTPNPAEYRTLSALVVAEIVVNEGGILTPIEELATPGILIVTNLIRDLSPIIRYLIGDRAK